MPNIGRFNQTNSISSTSKSGGAAKAGAAAGKAAAAGASAAGSKGPVAKAGDTVTLSGVIGQAGAASGTIAIPQDSAGPLKKSQHADALLKAGKELTVEKRQDCTCKCISEDLFKKFMNEFQSLPEAM